MPAEPPAGPVIVNSTPLIALWSVMRLELLRDLFGEVLIPQAVHDEFLAVEPAAWAQALTHATWIKPAFLAFPNRALEFNGLDRGEAEVLALADERQASVVVIDERRARRYATRLGIPVTGTIARRAGPGPGGGRGGLRDSDGYDEDVAARVQGIAPPGPSSELCYRPGQRCRRPVQYKHRRPPTDE
jgi:predicted nucleic acid-binding protein